MGNANDVLSAARRGVVHSDTANNATGPELLIEMHEIGDKLYDAGKQNTILLRNSLCFLVLVLLLWLVIYLCKAFRRKHRRLLPPVPLDYKRQSELIKAHRSSNA